MTPRQLIAIDNPCALAEDTIDERFHRSHVIRGLRITTLLSVNK